MQRFTIDLDGPLHGIHYGGVGRTVLLVHGLSGAAVNWASMAEGLTNYGRVLAPELPGFGRTPPAGRSVSVEDQATLLAEFIRRESAGAALVIGNSMGALASMILAGRNPDLVDRLALINPPAPTPTLRGTSFVWSTMFFNLTPGLNRLWLAWLRRQGNAEQRTSAAIDFLAFRPERISSYIRRLHSDVAAERDTMPWIYDAYLQAYRSVIRNLVPYARFDRMARRVRVPTLLIHGTEDMVAPRAAVERLASLRPDWRHRPLVDVGHIPMMEAPQLCLDVVAEFMNDAEPTARSIRSPGPSRRIDALSPTPENVGAAMYWQPSHA